MIRPTFEIDLDVVGVVEGHDALVGRLVVLVELEARGKHEHGRRDGTAAATSASASFSAGSRHVDPILAAANRDNVSGQSGRNFRSFFGKECVNEKLRFRLHPTLAPQEIGKPYFVSRHSEWSREQGNRLVAECSLLRDLEIHSF